MANKKGEKYQCEECGLIIVVDEPCGCETTELLCCNVPMKPVKATTPKPKAKPKAKAKPVKSAKATKAKPKRKAKK